MTIEVALHDRMAGHAGLSALVSNRIYPLRMPQGVTFPAVTYHRVSSQPVSAFGADTGLEAARFQVSAWSDSRTPLAAHDVAVEIRAALQRFRGTQTGIVIQGIFLENQIDLYEPDTEVWQVALDFMVHFGE